MNGRTATNAVFGIMLVLALGGCAGLSAESPAVQPAWESCPAAVPDDSQDALDLPPLTGDFRPVAAVICGSRIERRPGGGEDLLAVEERAGDVTALVDALRLPSEERTDGFCTMEQVTVPWFVLLDEQGRWIRPGVPADACGKPRPEVRAAFDQLRTERVSSRVQRQLETDEAAKTGCSQTHADMAWVAGVHEMSGGTADIPGAEATVRRCVYRVPETERGSPKPAGDFQSGGPVPAGDWAAIRTELANAGPAAACTTPSSRFALLHAPGTQIYVEADGCRRVLFDTGTGSALRQGSTTLTGLLL